VSTGSDVSIREMLGLLAEAMGVELDPEPELRPRDPDDAPSILLDPSRTERDFGWRADVPLSDGIKRTIEDYRSRGVGRTHTHLSSAAMRAGAEPEKLPT
jgi:UDP-glucose 4-epimerase